MEIIAKIRKKLKKKNSKRWVSYFLLLLFTIVENCKREGIDPFTYLRDVFGNVGIITNKNVGDWTPSGWAKRHGLGMMKAS